MDQAEVVEVGERGPVPKRADAKAGHRSKAELEVDEAPSGAPATCPPAPDYWHTYAKAWYESLADSGQSYWYERSDWMHAIILGEVLHREFSPKPVVLENPEGGTYIEMVKQPVPGQALNAILKGMTDLLTTEAARRRAAINLKKSELDADDDDTLGGDVVDASDRFQGKTG